MGEYQPGDRVNGFVLRDDHAWQPILGETCYVCLCPLPAPRRRWWQSGVPAERCTGRARFSCWPMFLARTGRRLDIERVPVLLQKKALDLYFENLEDLLPPYMRRAKEQGHLISDTELFEVHSRSWQRSLNDMSRLVHRGL